MSSPHRRASSFEEANGFREAAAVEPDSRNTRQQIRCTRLACGCSLFMCLLWPALVVTGIVLTITPNPREEQLSLLDTLTGTYPATRAAMQLTSVSAGTTALFLQYDDRAVVGTTERSQFFQTVTRIQLEENNGPNHGVVTVSMAYQGHPFLIDSPPVMLQKPATKEMTCTIGYSSVCGTQSCCTDTAMEGKCRQELGPQSTSSVTFTSYTGTPCSLGEVCGQCHYNQFLSALCVVVEWDSVFGWTRDLTKNSCLYPFDMDGQIFGDADLGVNVFLRTKDDPFEVMQELTRGSMTLPPTKANERSGGRGALLCGILVLLVVLALIGLVRCCHFDVFDPIELKVMLGLPLSDEQLEERQARLEAEEGFEEDETQNLAAPMLSKHLSDLSDQEASAHPRSGNNSPRSPLSPHGPAGSSPTRRHDLRSPTPVHPGSPTRRLDLSGSPTAPRPTDRYTGYGEVLPQSPRGRGQLDSSQEEYPPYRRSGSFMTPPIPPTVPPPRVVQDPRAISRPSSFTLQRYGSGRGLTYDDDDGGL